MIDEYVRYDRAKHYLHLPTAPHHKHLGEKDVIAANAPDLQSVLKEIESGLKKTRRRRQSRLAS